MVTERHAGWRFCGTPADRTRHSRGADSRARRKTSGWYRLALKWHQPPNLSLRGGRRPTWQSREGSCDFADGFPVVRPCSARLPRRFAPRNDTSGERAVHQCTCAVELPSARCSGNAATDAIGSYRFIARLFVSPVRRRERHAAPLQFSIEMRTKCAKKYRKHRLPVVSACQKSPFGLFRQAAFRIAK